MGLAATTWVPMGAQVPVLSLNHHPNPSQGRQKGFRKRQISEILQVSLNSLHNGNFGALGGPWFGLYGLGGHYVGSHGCSSTRIVTKSSPKPIIGATGGFPKKSNFGNLASVTKQPTQQQFWGFWGGHGSGYMGLAATTWVPMGAQVPVLSLNHHPNPSQGRQKGFRKRQISEILQVSLNSLSGVKTAKSSPARGHMGGADWGYLELGPGTPAMG